MYEIMLTCFDLTMIGTGPIGIFEHIVTEMINEFPGVDLRECDWKVSDLSDSEEISDV